MAKRIFALKELSMEPVWSLDPTNFLEHMFHAFKQENHFIHRRLDRQYVEELQAHIGSNPEAVELIARDYDDNTDAKMLKYGKRGLIDFVTYYTAVLKTEDITIDEDEAPKTKKKSIAPHQPKPNDQ